ASTRLAAAIARTCLPRQRRRCRPHLPCARRPRSRVVNVCTRRSRLRPDDPFIADERRISLWQCPSFGFFPYSGPCGPEPAGGRGPTASPEGSRKRTSVSTVVMSAKGHQQTSLSRQTVLRSLFHCPRSDIKVLPFLPAPLFGDAD